MAIEITQKRHTFPVNFENYTSEEHLNQETVSKKSRIELLYPGKASREEILEGTPAYPLREIAHYGQKRLDGWYNRLIWGDNLFVLKSLLGDAEVAQKVSLIYIDPPFATNQQYRCGDSRTSTMSWSQEDALAYDDTLLGATYLEFLRQRIILLRELLADNGSIYIHIDCKIGHYVKILMDEIFGQDRFINDITRVKCNPKNFTRKAFGNVKDMILFYSRTKEYIWNDPREEMSDEDIQRLFPKIDEYGRRYTTTPLHAPGETINGPTGLPWKGIMPPKGRHWRYPPDELTKLDEQGLIEWSPAGNPRKKIYAEDVIVRGKKRQDIWKFKDPTYPSYPTEKNLDMLKMIIQTSSNPGDLVLDSFAGSGTTLVAAEETSRRWIGIDNSWRAIEKCQKRLRVLKGHSSFTLYKLEVVTN